MNKNQSGFTLIELVLVIVILGILAATALPRFANLGVEARQASVQGMAGGMRAAIILAKSKWLAVASSAQSSVEMNGTFIYVMNTGTMTGVSTNLLGNPLGQVSGLTLAMESTAGFTVTYPTASRVNFMPIGAPSSAGCSADYDETLGTVIVSHTVC